MEEKPFLQSDWIDLVCLTTPLPVQIFLIGQGLHAEPIIGKENDVTKINLNELGLIPGDGLLWAA